MRTRRFPRVGPALLVAAAYAAIAVGTVTVTAELARVHPSALHELQAMIAQISPFSWPMMPSTSAPPLLQEQTPSATGQQGTGNMPTTGTPLPQPDQGLPVGPGGDLLMPAAPAPESTLLLGKDLLSRRQASIAALKNASEHTGGALSCFDRTGNAVIPIDDVQTTCDPDQGQYFKQAAENAADPELLARIGERFPKAEPSLQEHLRSIVSSIMTKLHPFGSTTSVQSLIAWLQDVPPPPFGGERARARDIVQRISPLHGTAMRIDTTTQHGAAASPNLNVPQNMQNSTPMQPLPEFPPMQDAMPNQATWPDNSMQPESTTMPSPYEEPFPLIDEPWSF